MKSCVANDILQMHGCNYCRISDGKRGGGSFHLLSLQRVLGDLHGSRFRLFSLPCYEQLDETAAPWASLLTPNLPPHSTPL